MFRVGFGYDVHAFAQGRPLWVGGVHIDAPYGLDGHSDADVLIHALCDALLGAAALRDIGYHFPDTGAEYLNIDSKLLLRRTIELLQAEGYCVGNVDCTVCAQKPKLSPYIPAMQKTMAACMGVEADCVSIKATTTEHLGFVGREEGIAAQAVALIYKA